VYILHEDLEGYDYQKNISNIALVIINFQKIDKAKFQHLSKINIFSAKFKLFLVNLEIKLIENILLYLEENFAVYLPYLEQKVIHGDLHPQNLLKKKKELFVKDFECLRVGEELFDLAFFVGCVIADHPYKIENTHIDELFKLFSDKIIPTKTSVETFFELLIVTRLHCLYAWWEAGSKDKFDNEILLLDYLYSQRAAFKQYFNNLFEDKIRNHVTKWVIADSIISADTAIVKNEIEIQNIYRYVEFKNYYLSNMDDVLQELPFVVIAFAKENNLLKIINVINIAEEAFSQIPADEILKILLRVYVNASLDFAKHFNRSALDLLIEKVTELLNEYGYLFEVKIAMAYITRNYCALLDELLDWGPIPDKVCLIRNMYVKNDYNILLAEELARILSGAIIAFLKQENAQQLNDYIKELDGLFKKFPNSTKIKGAYLVARKNMKLS